MTKNELMKLIENNLGKSLKFDGVVVPNSDIDNLNDWRVFKNEQEAIIEYLFCNETEEFKDEWYSNFHYLDTASIIHDIKANTNWEFLSDYNLEQELDFIEEKPSKSKTKKI